MVATINNTVINAQTPAPAAAPQQQYNQQQHPAQDLFFGLNSKMSAFGGGGEYFDKIFTKFEEKVKALNTDNRTGEKYALHKLIKTTAGLNYSAIILSEKADDLVVMHTLMIERTGDYPTPLFETLGGTRYELLRTPADAIDHKYMSQAQKLVGDFYNIPAHAVVAVDATLVPNEFNVENESAINDLYMNTLNAIDGEVFIRSASFRAVNLPAIVANSRTGKFVVNMYFNSNEAHLINEAGLPVRQDVCVALSYKHNTSSNDRSINQGDDTTEIVKTFGYIDFQWVGPTNNGQMSGTQAFVPNFVITRIECGKIPTPDITLLGVASVLAINEDMSWMQAFKASAMRKGEVDFNDIGALNVEGNIERNTTGYGKKIDTKSKDFTLTMLNTLVSQLVYPNMIISIDVGQASPDTWYENVFYYASRGDTFDANKRVIDAIRAMTNTVMDIPNNLPIFSPLVNKVYGGFYKTKDGIKDLRQITSYLAMANYAMETGQEPKIVSEYTNSFYATSVPSDIRAAERKKFIDAMSNNTAVYKQSFNRLTFSAAFLSTLLGSLKQVGFAPVPGNMMQNNDMFFRRATADFSSSLLGNDMRLMSNVNNYNNMYQPQAFVRQY